MITARTPPGTATRTTVAKRWATISKISNICVTMTSYPAVRKTAHHAPVLAELEFSMHRIRIAATLSIIQSCQTGSRPSS
jgi:hypothetical protein